jgi:glucokinase
VTAAVVDLELRKVLDQSLTTHSVNPDASADELLGTWANQASKAWQQAGKPGLTHIGVTMPGPFEYDTGVSRLEHKFASLYGQNIGTVLKKRILPADQQEILIRFGNDASLFALGEWWAGAAQGYRKVIGVTLGTGLGGGFVQEGHICYSRPDIPPKGAIWNLPYLGGIAEEYVSGSALTRAYRPLAKQQINPTEIARRAQAGDAVARAVFSDLGQHLGNILKPWVERFHPGCVVVGGNIARAWPLFHQPLEAILTSQTQVAVSTLFDKANLLGAAALGSKESI